MEEIEKNGAFAFRTFRVIFRKHNIHKATRATYKNHWGYCCVDLLFLVRFRRNAWAWWSRVGSARRSNKTHLAGSGRRRRKIQPQLELRAVLVPPAHLSLSLWGLRKRFWLYWEVVFLLVMLMPFYKTNTQSWLEVKREIYSLRPNLTIIVKQ